MASPNQQSSSYDKTPIDPFILKQNTKLRQVIQNFFDKAANIIVQSRINVKRKGGNSISGSQSTTKMNKWFNLYLSKDVIPKEDLRLWRSVSLSTPVPPMIIEVYLDLKGLTNKQTVILKDDNGNPWTVCKAASKKSEVVLERWLIEFDVNSSTGASFDELPFVYKQAIVLLRCLYTYERLLPVYKYKARLNQIGLSLGFRIIDGKSSISSKGRIGLSKPIIPHQMLLSDNHLNHKFFQNIQTSFGSLKISVAYRKHGDFSILENEELLSTHFIRFEESNRSPVSFEVKQTTDSTDAVHAVTSDVEPESVMVSNLNIDEPQDRSVDHRSSFASKIDADNSVSVSPCTSSMHGSKESSPVYRKPTAATVSVQRPSIHPFKVGSISSSPPAASANYCSTSLERKISITSNKSASNASLAAMLRNPRSSTSSTNSNLPIAQPNPHVTSFPRSISSSHGSNLHHEPEQMQSGMADSTTNTPKFSSSFGSRASRRFSNSSLRHNSILGNDVASILGTSAGSTSSGPPMSGFYVEDDIGDFVRMIDSKGDLRLSGFGSNDHRSFSPGSNSQLDVLNKFHQLKNQHQQLSESVNASLIFQHNQLASRPSSRKSSHSAYSRSPSIRADSYDNSHLPSINTRLREYVLDDAKKIISNSRPEIFDSEGSCNDFYNKQPGGSTTSTASFHPVSNSNTGKEEIKGLATTPSTYNHRKTNIYPNVFEDESEDEYFSGKITKEQQQSSMKPSVSTHTSTQPEYYDDELLFPMSDMNLKH